MPLIVAVTVQPSEVFQRDENNIYVVFPITYSQAVLGDTITVPSIDGKVEVNVPEGTQSGTTFRLRTFFPDVRNDILRKF